MRKRINDDLHILETGESFSPAFAKAAFKKYTTSLGQERVLSDTTFAGVVGTAIREFGLQENKLRDAFGLTAGAIALWQEKRSLPQPAVRPVIAEWIGTQL